jgi:hypothetical protein
MIKQQKMTVDAATSQSQVAAGMAKISKTRKMKRMTIKEQLELKEISLDNFDFDDVIENVDKLMTYYFKEDKEVIQKTIDELYSKFCSKIDYDYVRFLKLAEKNRDIKEWFGVHNKLVAGKGEVVNYVLDLYFQMTMVPSYDVYNDVLIHAYLEDIQPYLN